MIGISLGVLCLGFSLALLSSRLFFTGPFNIYY